MLLLWAGLRSVLSGGIEATTGRTSNPGTLNRILGGGTRPPYEGFSYD